MARDVAIVLNSGGVKSAVVSALAQQKYRPVLLHFEASAEPTSGRRVFFDHQVQHFRPFREHTVAIPWVAALQQQGVPDNLATRSAGAQYLELGSLIGIAARFAEFHNAAAIYLGTSVGTDTDALARMTEFVQVWNELIQLPAGQGEIELSAPLLELERWQIVDLGLQINTPFDKTWSCDRAGPDPCWECLGCRAREAAFQQTGKADPLRAGRR